MLRRPVESAVNTHAVIDAELRGLHSLALFLALVSGLATPGVLAGQSTHPRQRVIDVAATVIRGQRLVATARCRNPDFLGSPIQIKPDLLRMKLHQ